MAARVPRAYDKLLPVHPDVEAYVARALDLEEDVLRTVKAKARELRFPSISAEAGRTLEVFARAVGARRAVELGTGTGYSGIWIARGLGPRGRLVTVDGSPEMAALARSHFARAGLAKAVTVHEGACLAYLAGVKPGSLDLVFADATKSEYPEYLEAGERALRGGGVFAADNVFWQGRVLGYDPKDAASVSDADTRGILEFTRRIARPPWRTQIFPFGDGLSVSLKLD